MQWSADTNAGFTGGMPWIRVNPDYRTVNVAAEEGDTGSVLNYFRRLVRLRRSEPVLVYGKYQLLDRENPDVFAYTRTLNGRTLMVALSFSPAGARPYLLGTPSVRHSLTTFRNRPCAVRSCGSSRTRRLPWSSGPNDRGVMPARTPAVASYCRSSSSAALPS